MEEPEGCWSRKRLPVRFAVAEPGTMRDLGERSEKSVTRNDISGGDIGRKILQKAGFMEGDIKEDRALTSQGLPLVWNEEFVGWDILLKVFNGA
jgi:hypothetical protein